MNIIDIITERETNFMFDVLTFNPQNEQVRT